MFKGFALGLITLVSISMTAQKKPLDHSVYDSWQSIGEKMISNDGRWVCYTIDPQEGDAELIIQSSDAKYKKVIPRGWDMRFTQDSRFAIFRIKPYFKELHDGRVKKKKTDDMPKDSFAIVELGMDTVWKRPRVKNYKLPDQSFGWVAYHLEKSAEQRARTGDRKTDSLTRIIDSLKSVIAGSGKKRKNDDSMNDFALANDFDMDAEGDDVTILPAEPGTDLVLRNLTSRQEIIFANVMEYYFSKNAAKLLLDMSRNPKDSFSKPYVLVYDLRMGRLDTLSRGGNDFKNFSFSEDGVQVAFVAERDAKPKDLQKFYKLYYYREGMDSAEAIVDKNSLGMMIGMSVSEFGQTNFSKSGARLFFGVGAIKPPKDTSIAEIDQARLDIWHYNDDYLQTVQLNRLQRDLQENYLAVIIPETRIIHQLGSRELPTVYQTNEGDGDRFFAITDFGKRIESQWNNITKKDIYAIDVNTGSRRLVKSDMLGVFNVNYISPSGKYVMWYDYKARNYFAWGGDSIRNISSRIRTPLYNEENDSPTDPSPYGLMGWKEDESSVFLYDRYDVWAVSPDNRQVPALIFPAVSDNRKRKVVMRYVKTDAEERFITPTQDILFRLFYEVDKRGGLYKVNLMGDTAASALLRKVEAKFTFVSRAKSASVFLFSKETFQRSPDLYVSALSPDSSEPETRLSSINPQQRTYNWGSAELYQYKTFSGKTSEGILYKPEDFDFTRKYPLILYFYEKLSNDLYDYEPPAPTPSRLNIPFFVSRGYLVFAPDITYTIGHPAKSAYDYIVSAAKDLAKHSWVDEDNMGIQGQSWGGIQVAQLITMTNMFKAAWAGAPVANMTSAYGGIRWESGVTRQFQYEKTQSRIGATLWEKPELYIENSPLFSLPKVKTPLVIMSNDADGAVPWYQGIELFTGMRRLGKKVWMLSYNAEAHNLVQRRNKKDIQIREQQFFDWLLKGVPATRWIREGVPATLKGREYGFD